MKSNSIATAVLLAMFLLLSGADSLLLAQVTIQTEGGRSVVLPQGADPFGGGNPFGNVPNGVPQGGRPQPTGQKPNEKEKKGDDAKKDGKDQDGEDKKEEGKPGNVQRSAEPPSAPDPNELKVAPNEEGLLYFQFRNQPWPDVLRWYADVCHLSFDWQELPGDYINLATQRPHTLEETGDMINRALLMRGFTILQNNETLTVAKIEGLNPSLVPRVSPDELSGLPPHKFVRTSFQLAWLLAEEVNQEFASMISKNGKLTPLQSTNRLEAMDAVANLLDIHNILQQEQSAMAMENLAKEFPLTHARASAVKLQLEQFLGIQSSSSGSSGGFSSSSSARMMQQMQQMQQQMQKQMQAAAKAGAGGSSRSPRSDEVFLVANERSNSIIVHAPPNKMAIIAAFITRVDVPNENSADYVRLQSRMKVFRLASLGPQELVNSLNAMDVLEPTTRLQVDADNNAIIAYASVADQYLIQSVIDRLDGSERRFEVVQLRRLDAESVAGSIKFLMGAEEEDSNSSRSRRYYDPWSYSYGSSSRQQNDDKMRVGANVQDNQLLLWVNDIEMEEIQNLLVKLGEIPAEGTRPSTLRVIDASRQPETFEYLKRLKEQWDRVSPNPLVIPDEAEFETKVEEEAGSDNEKSNAPASQPEVSSDEEKPKAVPDSADNKITARSFRDRHSGPIFLTSAEDEEETSSETSTNPSAELADDATAQSDPRSNLEKAQDGAPPVKIFLDRAGNLVIQSDDTEALDRLEEIMQRNKPPRRSYDVFQIKHARASWVSLNLEEYFEKQEDNEPSFFAIFSGFGNNNDKDEAQLGDRPPLRFIWDNDTNTIVVQGADDVDRQTIKELIELWDVPEQIDKSSIRYTKLVKIRYSRAENIVNTIKEAYRDLLSANDSTFQEGAGEEGESKRGGGRGGIQGDGFNFSGLKGKLSLGPDALTNSILISVEGEDLLKIVEDIIQELDEAAKDQGAVEVYKVTGGISGRSLEKALRAALSQKAPQPNQPNQGQPQQPGQPNKEASPQIEGDPFQASPAGGRRSRGRGNR